MTQVTTYVWEFRKFKSLDNLDNIVNRKLDKTKDTSEQVEILLAADHRRAEIVSGSTYDPGKIPASVWRML